VAGGRRRRRELILFGDLELLASLPPTLAERVAPLVGILRLVGLVALVIVLARPQMGRRAEERETEGIAIQVALDTSGSMRALDFQIDGEPADRMEVVKRSFAHFVRGDGDDLPGRASDLIGLIAFGGYADSKAPLTLDHDALLEVATTLEVPEEIVHRGRIVNEEELQTAIGDALALAVERIKDAPTRSKVVILLTDGENTAGIIDPRQAAELAATLGIRVYTIGVGSNGMAPFPARDAFGNTILQRRPVRLDEELLDDIAEQTGGIYRNARDTEALRQVYAEIDRLERTRLAGLVEVEWEERYQVVALAALALLALYELLASTRFREVPA
jgi:Ca-activated chloride channel family protein